MATTRQRLPKLTPPNVAKTVRTSRLLERMKGSLQGPLTWLHGPGGSGKTTLAAQALVATDRPRVWLEVDESDADPATFFNSLTGAAQSAFARRRFRMPALNPEYLASISMFARTYFRDLFATLPPDTVVVLDNTQFIDDSKVFIDVVQAALDEMPDSNSVVVTSRNAPGPALARRRSTQQITCITWAELRRDDDEMSAIAELAGRALSPDTLALLDGWVAGVMLAPDDLAQAEFDLSVEGADELAFDYFAAEVFENEPPQVQKFLAANALWTRFPATLAGELTDFADAARRLRQLTRRNFFLTTYGTRPLRYAFHPLFRRFLLARASELFTPEELRALQLRAASLLEGAGDLEAALALRVDGEDWPTVARLTNAYGPELLHAGRHLRMLRWLDAVPEAVVEQTPVFALWRGIARVVHQPRRGFIELSQAYDGFVRTVDHTGQFMTLVAILESQVLMGSFRQSAERLDQLLAVRAAEPALATRHFDQTAALGVLGTMAIIAPDHAQIEYWSNVTLDVAREHRQTHRRLMAGAILTYLHTARGEQAKAQVLANELQPLVAQPERIPYAAITWLTMRSQRQYWFADSVAGLTQTAQACWRLSRQAGIQTTDHFISDCACLGAFALNDAYEARAQIERLTQSGVPHTAYHRAYYYLKLAWFEWLQHNATASRGFLELALSAATSQMTPLIECHVRLGRSVLYIDEREYGAALRECARVRSTARAHGLRPVSIMVRWLTARICLAKQQTSRAQRLLEHVMPLAAQAQLRRSVFYRPSDLAALALFALQRGIEPGYARQLITGLELPPPTGIASARDWAFEAEVYCLGEPRLRRQGESIRFGRKAPRRALRLLYAVIALGGKRVGMSRLTELVWSDSDREQAQKAMRTALYRLRRLLGDECLETDGDAVSINQSRCFVDALRFDALTRAWQPRDVDANALHLKSLLDLYQGDFLPGEPASWTIDMRARLRKRCLRLLEDAATIEAKADNWSGALRWYQRGLELDPSAELLYRGALHAQLQLGLYADALSTYAECAEALQRIHAIAPSPTLQALRDEAKSRAQKRD